MTDKQFAKYGVKHIVGGGGEVTIAGYAIKALTDVILTSIKGPKLENNAGAVGELTSIAIAKGDVLVLGVITKITVPAAAEVLVAKLA